MTELVELGDLLADQIPGLGRQNPEGEYRSKLVSVRRLQAKGMPDASIEKALGVCLHPADRLGVEIGDPAHLAFRIRWDRPSRRGNDALSVQGTLEILVRGERVLARQQTPPSWRIAPAPILSQLSKCWPQIVFEPALNDDGSAGDQAGVSLFHARADNRRVAVRVKRVGNSICINLAREEWRVDFERAIKVLEQLGNLLYERLTDDRPVTIATEWPKRNEIEPIEALSLASGKPTPTVLRHLAQRLTVLGKKFDLASLTYSTPEIVVAARMAPTYLSDFEIVRLLKAIDEVPAGTTSELLYEASSAAVKWLDDNFQPKWKDFDEGYAIANWVRRYFDVNDNALFDVESLFGKWSISIINRELEPRLDAIAVWGPSHGPAVIINTNGMHSRSSGGRRATLAHEFCHMLLDRKLALPLVEVLGGRVARKIEARARAFAAELLLPRSVARRLVQKSISVPTALDELVDHYRVSASLAAWQIINGTETLTSEEKKWANDIAYGPSGRTAASAQYFAPVP
jgi:Zn-dependent peptidase ImmA (M78 family)